MHKAMLFMGEHKTHQFLSSFANEILGLVHRSYPEVHGNNSHGGQDKDRQGVRAALPSEDSSRITGRARSQSKAAHAVD